MLVFSNNCCGAYLYNYLDVQYNNPAIWCRILFDSMYELIINYHDIDWLNYEIRKSILKQNTFDIIVDDRLFINYSHYMFDPNYKTVNTTSKYDDLHKVHYMGDVKYCKIWEYVVQKYVIRSKRLLECNEQPCFIIRDDEHLLSRTMRSTAHTIKDIIDITPYKTIILTDNRTLLSTNPNCKIYHSSMTLHPDYNIKAVLNNIKTFFQLTY